jgi:predicted RNA-binding protein with PUA-like domain
LECADFSALALRKESSDKTPHSKTSMVKKKKTTQAKKASEPAGFWLVKQEPETYSWDDLVRDGRTDWTGVRNFQARNNLRQMKAGDAVLFYHSGASKSVVGIAEVARSGYPDPTADDAQWVAVDIKPVKPLKEPVTLAAMRDHPSLSNFSLIRQSRLSVMPVTKDEFQAILEMGGSR